MAIDDSTIEQLLAQASTREQVAVGRLLEYHRQRLRRMVAARMDRRLAARIDPSEVVQEVLLEAAQGLSEYIQARPVPYFVWLRDLARDRLVWWTRRHTAKKRDAFRDVPLGFSPAGGTDQPLVDRLVDRGTSPSGRVIREEQRLRVRALISLLEVCDRRVIELRYLEGLSFAAIASVLEIGVGAAQMRHLRALERLRDQLDTHGVKLEKGEVSE